MRGDRGLPPDRRRRSVRGGSRPCHARRGLRSRKRAVEKKDSAEAARLFQRAETRHPDHADLQNILGFSYLKLSFAPWLLLPLGTWRNLVSRALFGEKRRCIPFRKFHARHASKAFAGCELG
jgi:hypothetical protein